MKIQRSFASGRASQLALLCTSHDRRCVSPRVKKNKQRDRARTKLLPTLHPQLLDLAIDLRGLERNAERCQCQDGHKERLPGMPLQEITQLTQLIL